MVHRLSTLVAALAVLLLPGCALRETHARCSSSADCAVGEHCYLQYCVIGDAGAPNAAAQPGLTDTQVAPSSETTACAPATALAATEGACCVEAASCYDGPADTLGVGVCTAGARACQGGRFAACSDSVLPGSESCDNQGSDDDCNGVVDDIAGRGEACTLSSGFGPCGEGRWACADGMSSLVCVRDGPEVSESCNSQDDDCDGQIDEGFDISSDAANCGVCGKACSSAELCCGGTCLAMTAASASGCPACSSENPCTDAASCCGGACRDMLRDRRHCGSCGHSCEQGERCCAGTCKTGDACAAAPPAVQLP
jgi:hypothetical protein